MIEYTKDDGRLTLPKRCYMQSVPHRFIVVLSANHDNIAEGLAQLGIPQVTSSYDAVDINQNKIEIDGYITDLETAKKIVKAMTAGSMRKHVRVFQITASEGPAKEIGLNDLLERRSLNTRTSRPGIKLAIELLRKKTASKKRR